MNRKVRRSGHKEKKRSQRDGAVLFEINTDKELHGASKEERTIVIFFDQDV